VRVGRRADCLRSRPSSSAMYGASQAASVRSARDITGTSRRATSLCVSRRGARRLAKERVDLGERGAVGH
jgi:hypothetical protein